MIRHCEWESLTKGASCIYCGYTLKRDYENSPICECRSTKYGLGTFIKNCLSALRIKKSSTCCSCTKREHKFNLFGWWVFGLFGYHKEKTKNQRTEQLLNTPYTPSPEKLARQQALLNAQTAQSS